MATRKDLLKAYGFTSQRLIRAMVDRNPEDMTSPLRRVAMGTFASLMIGVLMFAAFGIVGWLNPGKTSKWQKDKTVVVDKTSGGVYAYLEDTLYPTYNIASAKLATAGGPTVAVTTKSLRTVSELGATIGIPNAPNQLPDPSAMGGFPVRLCATAPQGSAGRYTTMEIGDASVPTPAANPTLVISDDRGGEYLVHDGVAHRAPKTGDRSALMVDLGFNQVVRPGNAFVRGLPQGSTLDPPTISRLGKTSSARVGGVTAIGTVFQVKATVASWYVLLDDGVAPIAGVEARALQLISQSKLVAVDSAAISAAQASPQQVTAADLPRDVPQPGQTATRPDASICATWSEPGGPRLSVDVTDLPTPTAQAKDPNAADLVKMPPLAGVLMQPDNVADSAANVSLVTTGMRYGLADADARAALGYRDTVVRRFPPQLIELIPQGLAAGQILSIPRAQAKS